MGIENQSDNNFYNCIVEFHVTDCLGKNHSILVIVCKNPQSNTKTKIVESSRCK